MLTGEHGVGVEKRDLMPAMFTEIDLDQQQRAQMRLRRRGPAQSRQGVPDAAPLRRARPHACARRQAAVSRSAAVLMPTMADDAAERRATPRMSRTPCAGRSASGKALEIVGQRHQARASAGRRRPIATLDLSGARPASRSTSRRSWCCRRAPARRSPRSRRWSPSNGQLLAFEPMDYGPLLGRRRRPRHHRRRRSRPISPARAGSRPAPRATISWLHGGHRPRRDLQGRRPGGEERHRLRSLQAAGRLLGHARGDDRGDHQGAAAPETEATAGRARARRRARRAGDGRGDGLACEVSGAAHLPAASAARFRRPARRPGASTALRLEGVAPSVAHRKAALRGAADAVRRRSRCWTTTASRALWRAVRDVDAVRGQPARAIGRCGAFRPRRRRAARSAGLIAPRRRRCFYDWAGGLIWVAMPRRRRCRRRRRSARAVARGRRPCHADPRAGRGARRGRRVRAAGRRRLRALTQRVKESFDPKGVLNPGRM